jgi:hypothetical protein
MGGATLWRAEGILADGVTGGVSGGWSLLIVVAIVYDWRTRGRPHKVYVYGGALVLLQLLLAVPISGTRTWLSVATFLEHLAG